MKTNFKIGQTVKFKNPEDGENDFLFTVIEVHPADGKIPEKLHVQLICDLPLKPTFCFFSTEFISA